MKRSLAVALLSMIPFGLWTVASADDDDRKSDFALFDGTNPTTEAPPFGGAECTVKGAATFYVAVTAHSSGPSGFVRPRLRTGTLSSTRSRRMGRSAFRSRSAGRKTWTPGSASPTVATRTARGWSAGLVP